MKFPATRPFCTLPFPFAVGSGRECTPLSFPPTEEEWAQGKLGRRLYVLPTQQLVITRLGDHANLDFNSGFFKRLRLASGN